MRRAHAWVRLDDTEPPADTPTANADDAREAETPLVTR
jgi:hypothetical protein